MGEEISPDLQICAIMSLIDMKGKFCSWKRI